MIGTQNSESNLTLFVAAQGEFGDAPDVSEATPASDQASEAPESSSETPAKSGGTFVTPFRIILIGLAVLAMGLVLQLVVVSGIQQRASQGRLFNQLRTELALGTAPRGPVDLSHRVIAPGTPIALIRIPAIDVNQVVVEGTKASVLATGPGHYISTVFPGGTGTSVILGRAAAYGGPFGNLHDLKRGDRVIVTTQVGTSVFRVINVRPAGAKVRPVPAGKARLTLGTASGAAFVPSGVLWVDADKVGPPLAAQNPIVATVPASQRPLGVDTGSLWGLVLWLGALGVLIAGAVWAWRRRGPAQAWIVFFAPAALLWILLTGQIVRLLPNLL